MGWIAQYAGQMVMLYLGVVLMWDAKYGYIFTSRKEPMPDDCMIDDNFFAEGGTGEDGEGFGGAIDNNNNINAFRTPRATLGSRKGTKSSSSSLTASLTEAAMDSTRGKRHTGVIVSVSNTIICSSSR